MKKRSILILFLSVIGLTSFAYPSMIVEHYTAERGLPNNIVNCTLKVAKALSGSALGMAYVVLTALSFVRTIIVTDSIRLIFLHVRFSVS